MNDVLYEYTSAYEFFIIDQELNEQLFQLECGFVNESMGLMSIQEGVIETIKTWFAKILKGIDRAITALKEKLTGLFNESLDHLAEKLNDPGRPDPATFKIPITNYHRYNFSKLTDGSYSANKAIGSPNFVNILAGLNGGEVGEPLTNRNEVLKAAYPDLYDEKLSIFDKMRQNVLISGKDTDQETYLDNEMLDECWNYVYNEYKPLIEKIEEDKSAVANQKKNVDAAAQFMVDAINNMKTAQANNPNNQTNEAYVFTEAYLLEADEDVKTQKIGDGEGKGPSKEKYAKALTTYIQVVTSIISAKCKLVNTAYMDKFRIVTYYCKQCGWKVRPTKKKG